MIIRPHSRTTNRGGMDADALASWTAAILCRFCARGPDTKAPEDWRTPKPGGAAGGSGRVCYRFCACMGNMNPPPTPPRRGAGRRRRLVRSPPGRGRGWVGLWRAKTPNTQLPNLLLGPGVEGHDRPLGFADHAIIISPAPALEPGFGRKEVRCETHQGDQDYQAHGRQNHRIVETHARKSRRALEVVKPGKSTSIPKRASRIFGDTAPMARLERETSSPSACACQPVAE